MRRIATGMLLALGLTGLATAASGPGEGRPIVFASSRVLNFWRSDIFVVDHAGHRVNVTETPNVTEREPAWAPDGVRLVVSRGFVTPIDLYIVNTRTHKQTRLTDAAGSELESAWSPDGRAIAFIRQNANHSDLVVRNLGSGTERILASEVPYEGVDPVWSPDGKHLAYVSGAGVTVVGRDGKSPRLLVARNPGFSHALRAWLPGGIVVVRRWATTGIALETVTLQGVRRPLRNPCGAGLPEWSPSGSEVVCAARAAGGSYRGGHIVFLDKRGRQRGAASLQSRTQHVIYEGFALRAGRYAAAAWVEERDADIWVTSADGQSAARLTNSPAEDHDPAWSSDGRTVVFVRTRHYQWRSGNLGSLMTSDTRTRRLHDLGVTGAQPDVERGGRRIAYANATGVAVYDPATRRSRVVARGARNPAWRPGTHSLAFVAGDAVRTVGATGRGTTTLFAYIGIGGLAWAPDGQTVAFSVRDKIGVWSPDTGVRVLLSDEENPLSSPSWSSDGRSIVYAAGWDNSIPYDPRAHFLQLWSVPAAGGEPHRLTAGPGFDFDPAWRQ